MPSAAARRLYEDQIPTFMSVFDLGTDDMDARGAITVVEPRLVGVEAPKSATDVALPQLRHSAMPSDPIHKHNDSTSTQNSESAESSPTTTMSCTDSSSLSDPSPSSSPESPVNLAPLSSSFAAANFGGLPSMGALSVSTSSDPDRPMTSPAPRRPRNMKGLSIQPPFNPLSNSLISEPSSPCFIKPNIPAMKRKPSQLSLKTSTSDLVSRTTLEIPSSPSVPSIPPILQRRALKHSTSSPHMLSSLRSATFGPVGGMTIPTVLERNESGLSEFLRPSQPPSIAGFDSAILEEESPIRTQIANRAAFEFEPYHEHENNEDQKTPGYPDGPIAIYDDNVYLYLEPTAEEASKFDVVINVAREVNNPFKILAEAKSSQESPLDASSPIPDTALTAATYKTAFEFFPEETSAETPTTPKAMPLKEPEYIHMPWDHNTDISQDLMMLCETIERKTREGKKVLVHCQQGASRSASLIIAYGIWQNPEMSVNDAYYAAQAKSRWISPNMRLMYCLQDFQKEVSKKKMLSPGSAYKPRSGRSQMKHRVTLSADAIDATAAKEPRSAPLPNEDGPSHGSGSERSPSRARGNSTPGRGEPISPGPSSAPSSFSWGDKEEDDDPGKPGRFQFDVTIEPPKSGCSLSPSSGGSCEPPTRPPPSPSLAGFAFADPPVSPGFPPPRPLFARAPSPLGFSQRKLGVPTGRISLKPLGLRTPPHYNINNNNDNNNNNNSKETIRERRVRVMRSFPDDAALLSPRAETMTSNPLHEAFAAATATTTTTITKTTSSFAGLQFVEVPPTPGESLFSPRETMFPRDPFFPFGRPTQSADPRSPPTKGETPIVRTIDEIL
ncbi:hypothetical protein VTK73DRAFT_8084 [Phialemonium thermophilum]|uniref:protein-tyrosine-phosphatase n=1 Tax=Phialemonium thermophilum TaxID=223376 RepID=A0ABR3WB52_9PEZI